MTIYLNNQPNFTEGQIRIVKGDTLKININAKDSAGATMNLTGGSAKLTVRKSPQVTGDSFASFTSSGGDIVLAATNPNLVLTVAPATTAAWEVGLYYYDLEFTDSGGVKRTWLMNTFEVIEHITA